MAIEKEDNEIDNDYGNVIRIKATVKRKCKDYDFEEVTVGAQSRDEQVL